MKKNKRVVSVSTMKGRFAGEKRKVVEALSQPESEWEDEEEDVKGDQARAAAVRAEEEAQKEREMFAKQQIYGSKPSEGLLTGMFKRGGSMVDLAAQAPAPPSPISRSKSVLAIPAAMVSPTRAVFTQANVELESSGDESDDDYLASSQVQRKIVAMTSKQAQPLTPTTRRRTIIMREMSESLRQSESWPNLLTQDIVLERQKSSTRINTMAPSRSSSAVDLTSSYDHGVPLERHNSQPVLERRRPTVLGGFLRPLTRVDPVTVQGSAILSASPEAPAMMRRSTESGIMERERRARRADSMDTSYRSHGW